MQRLLSYLLWPILGLFVIAWWAAMVVVFVLTAPFDPGRYAAGRFFRWAGIVATWMIPGWDFRVEGVMIDDPRRPYVVVANHESFADIFLLAHLPWEMKWLSKQAIFRIPVMGWMMVMAGDISVRRGERGSRAAALEAVRDRLDKGVSVVILPEGTRSPDGTLQPFHNGAFRVAVERQLPVLPVAVAGTGNAIPKHSGAFLPARAVARVLEPVDTAGLTMDDVADLRDRVRAMISAARDELRQDLSAGA